MNAFITDFQRHGRSPSALCSKFHKDFYVRNNEDIDFSEIDPLDHYLTHGWREGRNPNSWFDVNGYLDRNRDVKAIGAEPLRHYVEFGRIEGRRWSEHGLTPYEVVGSKFDTDYYLQTYPDIDEMVIDPIEHYIVFGWQEGRNPVSWFSTSIYLRDYEDIRTEGIEPFFHYLTFGKKEGRKIVGASPPLISENISGQSQYNKFSEVQAEFDDDFYALCYPDLADPMADRFEHYMVHGWIEGRNPAPWFNTKLYVEANPDIKKSQINPFVHYIMEGRDEGRPIFSAISNGPRILKQVEGSTLLDDKDISSFASVVFDPPFHMPQKFNSKCLDIHWVIPDFTPGSGGHSTIFRIIRFLEFMGHKNTIWLTHLSLHKTVKDAYDNVVRHFQPLKAEIRLCDETFFSQIGDAVIATGWQTVAHVSRTTGFLGRFYFVQDYEAAFYPLGSHAYCAELTYGIDLGCICASNWLAEKLQRDFGRWAKPFKLAYDETTYYPAERKRRRSPPFKIAVYARASTARRCVELVMVSLEMLAQRNVDFEVTLFASDVEKIAAPYPCIVEGTMSPADLGKLYQNSDLGICFSATNYSLVPQEMMACGLPVLELDSESSRTIFPEGVVTLTGPSPWQICNDIERLINHENLLDQQRDRAFEWVNGLSWSKSAGEILNVILSRLETIGHQPKQINRRAVKQYFKASVCIPTYNGGKQLIDIIDTIKQQETPWPFEIIVVDSESTDGSSAIVGMMEGVSFYSIPHSDFGHGKTRNLCASFSSGDFIVFLTQDAKPYDRHWLYNMVNVMEHFPDAAGAFGRHVAHPDSRTLTALDLEEHFKSFDSFPLSISRETNEKKWNEETSWQQMAHFYSDNNSCMRRSVWEIIPYPDIEYGEDQVWAKIILDRGYERLYVPSATVYHSHDYQPEEVMRRAFTEAVFFKQFFNYRLYNSNIPFDIQLDRMNANDQRRIVNKGYDIAILEQRKLENEAVLRGRMLGMESDELFYRNNG